MPPQSPIPIPQLGARAQASRGRAGISPSSGPALSPQPSTPQSNPLVAGNRGPTAAPSMQGAGQGTGNGFTGAFRSALAPAASAATSGAAQLQPFQGDLSGPTAVEQRWQVMQGQLNNPGMGQNAMEGALAHLMRPSAIQTFAEGALPGLSAQAQSSPIQDAYGRVGENRQQMAANPGLDPYYERATERGLRDVNANAAARGAYGSSAALDQGTDLVSNLQADQARNEAQYALQRSQDSRAWDDLMMRTGMNADASSRAWTGLGGQLAGMASSDSLGRASAGANIGSSMLGDQLSRIQLGMLGAGAATDAKRDRYNDQWNRMTGLGGALFNAAMGGAGANWDALMGATDAYSQGQLAPAMTGYNGAQTRFGQNTQAAQDIIGLMGGAGINPFGGLSGGVGAGGGGTPSYISNPVPGYTGTYEDALADIGIS